MGLWARHYIDEKLDDALWVVDISQGEPKFLFKYQSLGMYSVTGSKMLFINDDQIFLGTAHGIALWDLHLNKITAFAENKSYATTLLQCEEEVDVLLKNLNRPNEGHPTMISKGDYFFDFYHQNGLVIAAFNAGAQLWDMSKGKKVITFRDTDTPYSCLLVEEQKKAIIGVGEQFSPQKHPYGEPISCGIDGTSIKIWDLPLPPKSFYAGLKIKQVLFILFLYDLQKCCSCSLRSMRFPPDLKAELISLFRTFTDPKEKDYIKAKFFY